MMTFPLPSSFFFSNASRTASASASAFCLASASAASASALALASASAAAAAAASAVALASAAFPPLAALPPLAAGVGLPLAGVLWGDGSSLYVGRSRTQKADAQVRWDAAGVSFAADGDAFTARLLDLCALVEAEGATQPARLAHGQAEPLALAPLEPVGRGRARGVGRVVLSRQPKRASERECGAGARPSESLMRV